MTRTAHNGSSPRVGSVPCEHCGGRGRVTVADIRPLALDAGRQSQGHPHRFITAIRALRESAGLTLRDAKEAIEEAAGMAFYLTPAEPAAVAVSPSSGGAA